MTTYILGISAHYHESSAVLLKDGEMIAAVQEERFTRRKHDKAFPVNSIEYCLSLEGIGVEDLDLVAVCDLPSEALGLEEKDVREKTGFKGDILFYEHDLCHSAAAFYPSPFSEAAVLTVNSAVRKVSSSIGEGRGRDLTVMGRSFFPDSIGLFYSAFTHYCGFKPGSGEYKLMGLAAYGDSRYADLIREKAAVFCGVGDIKLNFDYFEPGAKYMFLNEDFSSLAGFPPREPETPLKKEYADLARSVQLITEEVILKKAAALKRDTGLPYLCMSGAMALNCAANGRILREGGFEDIWIQPASNDAGASLGAAFLAWHGHMKKERPVTGKSDKQKGSFLGPGFTPEEIGDFLEKEGIAHERPGKEELAGKVARLIAGGNIIGWFRGRMEFGPRALGARSILADPRSNRIHAFINSKVKFREPFRPFAPSVMAEKAGEYFDLDRESPYMLFAVPVALSKRLCRECPRDPESREEAEPCSEIPAVTHVDFSSRVQTVSRKDDPVFHELLKRFYEDHGCPVLVNTSFNVRGEPIVCTPKDAYECFMKTGMDYLVMGDYVVSKKEK
ncbi:MAG: hypothetical protein GF408_05430 [Candidatus Omnitrophica bacterium]|nr:hypothetical protein [Candidatus Omnitrophota bacterium]